MIEGKPSVMAEWAAMVRAAHPLFDSPPLLFEDRLAVSLLSTESRERLARNPELFRSEGMRLIRAMIMIRNRVAEQRLAMALRSGTRQYVILGAGLDTFAYRQAGAGSPATVFEVDHPATQQWKRERLDAAGITLPANLRFVPVDLTTHSLAEALSAAGFTRSEAAFFNWTGVTYYLTPETFHDTARFIAGQAAPSAVVFDFALRDAAVPAHLAAMSHDMAAFMATAGEPWQLQFDPAVLDTELRAMGFCHVAYLSPAAADRQFLHGRCDGLKAGPLVGLMVAETGRTT
jgi:methyltransferase (TIGR00027 family)